jgi:hypothetical protein
MYSAPYATRPSYEYDNPDGFSVGHDDDGNLFNYHPGRIGSSDEYYSAPYATSRPSYEYDTPDGFNVGRDGNLFNYHPDGSSHEYYYATRPSYEYDTPDGFNVGPGRIHMYTSSDDRRSNGGLASRSLDTKQACIQHTTLEN